MRSRAVVSSLLVAFGCCASPALAWAQTDDASRAAARDLGTAGVEAYQRDSFADASAKLEKAYRVLRVPSLGLWSARALVKVGQLVKASERYREVVRLPLGDGDQIVQKQALAEAATELDLLTPRIPRLVIKLQGGTADDTSVSVDGVTVSPALIGESLVIDPGKHVVEARRASQSVKVEVVVAEGETKDASLSLQPAAATGAPAPAPAPSGPAAPLASSSSPAADTGLGTRRTLALVVGGVGVIGVGVGSVLGLRAKSKLDEANDAGCSGATCPTQSGLDANDAAMTAGTFSTVAFAIGGVALTGGAVLWFTGGPEARKTARVGVGPGTIQLEAVW
jgi:hypothetical protein